MFFINSIKKAFREAREAQAAEKAQKQLYQDIEGSLAQKDPTRLKTLLDSIPDQQSFFKTRYSEFMKNVIDTGSVELFKTVYETLKDPNRQIVFDDSYYQGRYYVSRVNYASPLCVAMQAHKTAIADYLATSPLTDFRFGYNDYDGNVTSVIDIAKSLISKGEGMEPTLVKIMEGMAGQKEREAIDLRNSAQKLKQS